MDCKGMATRKPAPDAPDPEWLDEMVTKLISVLEAQLEAVSKLQPDGTPTSRAADARTLSSLERTLERLSRLARERASKHATREKKIAGHDDARAALERRLDKRLAAADKKGAAGKSQ
jgi:hypothetical protein